MTTDELIALYDQAIAAILTGAQEYRIGERVVRRADLATLQRERRQLKADSYSEGSNAITYWGSST